MSSVRTVQVTIDCADPEALSRFWAELLGYVNPPPPGREVAPGEDVFVAWRTFLAEVGVPESQWNSSSAAQDPEGVGPRLFFQQVPEGKSAEYFGFYNMVGKFGTVLGPALMGAVALFSGSTRVSILALLILFVGGGLLLWRVKVR